MSAGFSEAALYLTLYSILGWVCEVIYCSIPERRFINRGFLKGPYCPVYGVGAFLILAIASPLSAYPPLVFIVSLFAVTALEYFTGWLMESLFQIRWWDYSEKKLNLKGRVCLENALLFGIMGLAAVYGLHPLAQRLVGLIPGAIQRVLSSVIIAVFLFDLLYTLNTLLKLTEKLKTIQLYVAELDKYNDEYAWFQINDLPGSIARLREICQYGGADEKLVDILNKLDAVAQKRGERRLTIAFPHLRLKELGGATERLREVLSQQAETYKESWQRRIWGVAKRWGRDTAAGAKEAASSFAGGLSFHKLLWVFVAASVLGYIIETLFCLVTEGVVESRQGLLYGPFNQVYGFGAVLMVLLLTPLARRNDRWLFVGGAAVGGAFEFLCSLIQENVFGSVSWEYSGQAFSIGGRTSLMYMFFWGILGFVFIKGVYPALSRLIERIPKRQGVFFSWVFIITLTVNMLLSASAVYRWSERQQDIPPANAYMVFLDTVYPDERLEEVYPTMTMPPARE